MKTGLLLLSTCLFFLGTGCIRNSLSLFPPPPPPNTPTPQLPTVGVRSGGSAIAAYPVTQKEYFGTGPRQSIASTIDKDDPGTWPLFEYGELGFSMKLPFEPQLVDTGAVECFRIIKNGGDFFTDSSVSEYCNDSNSFPYVYKAHTRDADNNFEDYLGSVPDNFQGRPDWSFSWLTNFYRRGNAYVMGKKVIHPIVIIKRQTVPFIIFDPYEDDSGYSRQSYGALFNLPTNKDSDQKFKATVIEFFSDQLTLEQFVKLINTIRFFSLPGGESEDMGGSVSGQAGFTVTSSSATKASAVAIFDKTNPATWPRLTFKELGFSARLPFENQTDSNSQVGDYECQSEFEYSIGGQLPRQGYCYSREYFSVAWDGSGTNRPGTLKAERYGTTKSESVIIRPLKIFYRQGRAVLIFDLRQDFYLKANTKFVFPNSKAESVYGIAVKPLDGGVYMRLLEVVGSMEQVGNVVKSIQFYSGQ